MYITNSLNKETGKYDIPTAKLVGRSIFTKREVVQVMSDIWEEHLVLSSITERGTIDKVSISGWYGQKPEDQIKFEVDATAEAWEDFRKAREELYFNTEYAKELTEAHKTAVKGRVVKVVKGRNGKGSVGRVVVVMDAYYGMGYRGMESQKLGIALSPEKVTVEKNGKVFENYKDMVWAWHFNCEVEAVGVIEEAPIRQAAKEYAARELKRLQEDAARYAPKMVAA